MYSGLNSTRCFYSLPPHPLKILTFNKMNDVTVFWRWHAQVDNLLQSPTNKLKVSDNTEHLLMYFMVHKKTVLPQYILSSRVQKYQLWVVNSYQNFYWYRTKAAFTLFFKPYITKFPSTHVEEWNRLCTIYLLLILGPDLKYFLAKYKQYH